MLSMTPTLETPLRRSEIGVFATPMSIPRHLVNDDEAERRASRARASLNSYTSESTVAEHEGLQDCLKIFHENKISKDNAWSMLLIDHFSSLISKHHKSLSNFQVVGSTLEASGKIYGLRVDSVHSDVLRIASGLTRNKMVQDNNNDANDANDESGGLNESSADKNSNVHPTKPKAKVRKLVSTVTKNKDSICARLETNPFTDPMFAKLNSTIGDINSSKKLLNCVLPTVDSELRLRMNHKFWDSSDCDPNDAHGVEDYSGTNTATIPHISEFEPTDLFRPQLTGYRITDTPAEEDETNNDNDMDNDEDDDGGGVNDFNNDIDMDLAFDIDADVEPIHNTVGFMAVDLGNNDFNGLTIDDHSAILACKGLRRSAIVLEDLRPVDSSSVDLEYSYRVLDNINQFWAGPSYWKFKKLRSSKSLNVNSMTVPNNAANIAPRKKPLKKKIEPNLFEENSSIGSLFTPVNSKLASKLRKANITKKWDAKKLKLPTDLQLNRNRFEEFEDAPGCLFHAITDEPISRPSLNNQNNIYNHEEYESNLGVDDDNMDREMDDGGDNLPLEASNIQSMAQQNNTILEIGTEYIGAPEKVEKIDILFAKRAKVIDMKQLKRTCMNLIERQFDETKNNADLPQKDVLLDKDYRCGEAGFNSIYQHLPQVLNKNMQGSLSKSIAFYSILHLANDHKLRLTNNPTEGFLIRKIIDEESPKDKI